MLDRSRIVKHHNRSLYINDLDWCQSDYDYLSEQWEHKRPAWEASMTVCIAALCEKAKIAIAITDKKISSAYGDTESDLFFKWRLIHPQWAVMFAGDDVTQISDIVNAAEKRMTGTDGSIEAARSHVEEAYKNVRLKRAEDLYLASRGWTLAEFKKRGLELAGENLFLQIDRTITNVKLGISILAIGFANDKAHIFSVENPGISRDHSIPGFHAIGDGDINALSCLYQRGLRPETYAAKAIYYLFEAKKYAQKIGSVGEKTDIWVMGKEANQRGWIKSDRLETELEAVWNKVKPQDSGIKILKGVIAALKPEKTTEPKKPIKGSGRKK